MTSFGAFLLIQILGTALSQDWAYEEGIDGALGPKEWKKKYEFCSDPDQSPVNIVKDRAERLRGYEDNEYTSLQVRLSYMHVTNNGLYVSLKSNYMSWITFNKRRKYDYELAEIRFHWGQNNSVGSEHMIDGKSYPLEMQLIFFSTTYFKTYKESLEKGYGLIIVAVEFEISSKDNRVMSDVLDALDSIQEVGQTKTIQKMKSSFGQLFPENRNSFYIYQGSMTSPPCAYALWHIYMNPQTISSNQLEKFRQLNAKYGGKLTSNDRPIQPLGDRYVAYKT